MEYVHRARGLKIFLKNVKIILTLDKSGYYIYYRHMEGILENSVQTVPKNPLTEGENFV